MNARGEEDMREEIFIGNGVFQSMTAQSAVFPPIHQRRSQESTCHHTLNLEGSGPSVRERRHSPPALAGLDDDAHENNNSQWNATSSIVGDERDPEQTHHSSFFRSYIRGCDRYSLGVGRTSKKHHENTTPTII